MKGLLHDNVGMNCTDATDIEKINVGGQEVDSAKRRFVFGIDNVYYKLAVDSNGTATLEKVPTQSLTVDSVLEEGNKANELSGVSSVKGFAGKIIYPVIALFGEYGSLLPTASLSMEKVTSKDMYVYNDQSPIYELSDDGSEAKIISINVDKSITGSASADVSVSMLQNGVWSQYTSPQDCGGQNASAVRFRSLFRVRSFDGVDSATLNKVSIIYSSNRAPVTGNDSEIITITRNYENDIGFASIVVKHNKMVDSYMDAYVALRKNTGSRDNIEIGVGTGGTQTLTLGVPGEDGNVVADRNIDHNSLVVTVGGEVIDEYDFNMVRSHITVFADLGQQICASYKYGLGVEEWRKMTKVVTQPYNGSSDIQATKFELSINDAGNTITAIRLLLTRKTGSVTDLDLGFATGQAQTIILPHFARKDTMTSNVAFTYNDLTKEFSFVGDKDMPVKVSYEWTGETQTIHSIAPFWTFAPTVFATADGEGSDTSSIGGDESQQGAAMATIDLTRIKQQILYTQAFLTDLSNQVNAALEGNG